MILNKFSPIRFILLHIKFILLFYTFQQHSQNMAIDITVFIDQEFISYHF
jgi:hypothetical protein